MYKPKSSKMIIVEVLSIGTDRSEQTVQARSDCSYKEQYEQCLHCLPFQLYLLDATIFSNFKTIVIIVSGVSTVRISLICSFA